MQYPIQVPTPCHEAWNEMTPEGNGRHCDRCAKTVVDFTSWDTQAIHDYLQAQGANRTCGRFKTEQLAPLSDKDTFIQSLAHAHMPAYKKIAAILLLAFGMIQMSCNADANRPTNQPPLTGEISSAPLPPLDTTARDTIKLMTMGEPAVVIEQPKKKKPARPIMQQNTSDNYTTGVPMELPPPSTDTTAK